MKCMDGLCHLLSLNICSNNGKSNQGDQRQVHKGELNNHLLPKVLDSGNLHLGTENPDIGSLCLCRGKPDTIIFVSHF